MYLTLNEIKDQFSALKKTVDRVKSLERELKELLGNAERVLIFGSGSSFSLAKSFAAELVQMAGIPAFAVPAGDFIVQTGTYEKVARGALLISISRSGSTSEIIRAVKLARSMGASGCISYCAVENAEISALSDLDVEIPWSFDHSVCQTRTVTNLYGAALATAALCAGDEKTMQSLERAGGFYEAFSERYDGIFEQIAACEWDQAVVLADSTVAGLAEEGALAFKEICQHNSNFYHFLDVRHGPMVMIGKTSLVLAFVTGENRKLQEELLEDVRKKGALCVVFDCNACDNDGEEEKKAVWEMSQGVRIALPDTLDEKVSALFLMYGIHIITYQKALRKRVNPDQPDGLDAWIKLEN